MSLRSRITLAAGAVVIIVAAAAALALYPTVSSKLHEQIDSSLIEAVARFPQASSTPGENASQRKALQAGRVWVRCMRRHGIAEAPPGKVNPPNLPSPDSPIFRPAKAACRRSYRPAA